MSFELGLLMGLGKSAMRERETRTQREAMEREQTEKRNAQSLTMLQKLVETDDLLPDDARNVAAQRWTALAMNPKAKDTDYTKAIQDVWSIANQPRHTPQAIAGNAVRKMAEPDYSFLDSIAPGMGQATNAGMQQVAPRLPAPETISGLMTRGEVDSRNEARMRRQLEMQQEFSNKSTAKAIAVEGPDGVYRFDPEGNELGFTAFRTPAAPPKPPALSDFENFVEVARRAWQAQNPGKQMSPQQEELLWVEARRKFGQADDRPPQAPTLINGIHPSMFAGAAVWDSPSGPALVFPRMMNPNGQPVVPLTPGLKPQPKDYQARAYSFYERAKQANDVFDSIDSVFFGKSVLGQLWATNGPELLQTEFGKKYRQAQRQFTEARLRKDSGAAIPENEFKNDRRMYFPQPGDSRAIIEQKRAARQNLLNALEREGKAASPTGVPTGGAPTPTPTSAPVSAAPVSAGAPPTTRLPAPPPPPGFVPVRP